MRREVDTFQFVQETFELMRKDGILLVTQGNEKKPNIMTIGWGSLMKNIEDQVYPNKKMHLLYYGEILGTYALDYADRMLS
jgi:hypothetical protein